MFAFKELYSPLSALNTPSTDCESLSWTALTSNMIIARVLVNNQRVDHIFYSNNFKHIFFTGRAISNLI